MSEYTDPEASVLAGFKDVALAVSAGKTRIICVQVRPRLIRDGLDAVLRGLLTCHL